MENIDERLRAIALDAQKHPARSRLRQRALTRLIGAIQRSGKLCRPNRGQFQGFYEEIYAEALQQLFAFMCDRIDDYDPERAVLQWANFLLRRRFFIEASREFMPVLPKGVNPKEVKRLTLDDLEHMPQPDTHSPSAPLPTQEIRQYLEDDPTGAFREAHVTNEPQANFRDVALKRLSGYGWKEISVELNVKVPTLSSFYERSLARFAVHIRESLST